MVLVQVSLVLRVIVFIEVLRLVWRSRMTWAFVRISEVCVDASAAKGMSAVCYCRILHES